MLRGIVSLFLGVATSCLVATRADALSEWGTGAYAWTMECPSGCTNFSITDGSINQTDSHTYSSVDDLRGSAQADAAVTPSGGLNVPIVRAEAFSDGGLGSALADAFAVEGYTYFGGGSGSFTLNV